MRDILGPGDPRPVQLTGSALAPGPFVLLGDHAGDAVPIALESLGLAAEQLQRHIAIDIGVEALGKALSVRLAAPFLHQAYSRLVIDCNRDPADPTAIAASSDGTEVPANAGLPPARRQERIDAVFEPYHQAIADLLDAREAAGLATVIVALHSFTPVMDGFQRPWEIGVLHDGRREDFALRVLQALQADGTLSVGDNEPYRMDKTDYTVPRHAYPRHLRYLELEVRQDIIGSRREALAELLADVFSACA